MGPVALRSSLLRSAFTLVLGLGSVFAGGCDSEVELPRIEARQEGTAAGQTGVGVMMPSGLEIPDEGMAADDMLFYLRSFEPQDCTQNELPDWTEERVDFAWQVFFMLPADRLHPGTTIAIGGDGESDLGQLSSARGGSGGWLGDGHACEERRNYRELPVVGTILEVTSETVTIRFDNLCFDDDGPIVDTIDGEVVMYDDPSDDVVVDATGTYTFSLCAPVQ